MTLAMRQLASLFLVLAPLVAQQTPRAECFPVERLAEADRGPAAELFLKLMDSEALYTVAGGIKPMSGGYVSFRLPASATEAADVEAARRYLEAFRCGGELVATVHHFARLYPNDKTKQVERYFDGVVFHRTSLREAIRKHRDYFVPAGITESASPIETLMAVEYMEGPPRLRGLGYLFGYPDYAVDFFVSAAREQALTGQFVARDFVSSPTFARAERGVVYAVPKGHVESNADRELRERLAAVLAGYRKRRETYIGEGKAGIVELLRDWFCNAEQCNAPVAAR